APSACALRGSGGRVLGRWEALDQGAQPRVSAAGQSALATLPYAVVSPPTRRSAAWAAAAVAGGGLSRAGHRRRRGKTMGGLREGSVRRARAGARVPVAVPHRVAISNSRILGYENHEVTFRWRDYA